MSMTHNLDDIRRAFVLIRRSSPEQVSEIRCLKTRRGTLSGYSNNLDKLVEMAAELSGNVPAVYLTVNPIKPDLLARSQDKIKEYAQYTTSDDNIIKRLWFLIDIDPNPVAGISSTDGEHAAAQEKAKKIARWLVEHGVPAAAIVLADSGNGAHVLVAIDLPNDDESRELLQRCLEVVAFFFAEHPKEIDRSVYNAARIVKIYGTLACKGDNAPKRPHRLAGLVYVPKQLEICPKESLQAIAALLPERPKAEQNGRFGSYSSLDLADFIVRNGIAVKYEKTWQSWRMFVLEQCLFDSSHDRGEAYLAQHASGALDYKCHHNSCVDRSWSDVREIFDPGYQERRQNGAGQNPNARQQNDTEWPDPQALPDELPPVPSMKPQLIPEPFREWLCDIADRMQCPLDFPVIGAIISVAALIGRTLAIRPKKHDDWTVIANMFGGAVGRPGIMKTPALDDAKKPLQRLELEALAFFKEQEQAREVELMVLKAKKEEVQKKIKEALASGKSTEGFEIPQEKVSTQRRYILNDSTVEKLGELLNQNPNGLLLFRDELIGWLRTLDQQGHENDRAFYLEAWNGNGSYTYDRIGRGTLHIKAACVSILGGIQPGPLNNYLQSTLKGGAGADGLFQRFQLLVYPDDDPGPWKNIDRWPNTEAKNKAFAVFDKLAGRGFEGFVASSGAVSRDESSSGSIPFLRFSEQAQVVFDDWRAELERKIRAGDEHPAVEAHLSKYRSLMPSLALVFHVISTIDTGKASPVSEAAAKMAAAWCDYLEDHARRIYHGLIQRDVSTAHRLARKIQAGKLANPFTAREAYRKDWTGLDGEVIDAGAALLDELGWIKTERVAAGASGGRPTTRYWINPKIARKVD